MADISYCISCLVFLGIIMFVYFFKERINTIENRLFSGVMITTFVGLLLELLCYFLLVTNSSIDSILYIFVNRFILLYYLIWSTSFLIYIFVISGNIKDKINKDQAKYRFYYSLINIVLLFISALSPFNFLQKDKMVLPSGFLTEFVYIYCGICIIAMFILLFKDRKNLINKKYFPLYGLLVFGAICMYFQYKNPEVLLLSYVHVLVCYLMFFTIENPDVRMLENMTMLRDQADKANNAKSEFLSNMSHEIRTPLNAIVGFSESLKEDNLPEESMDKVDDIIMASNNLLDIVNGILDISKIEANKLEIIEKEYEIDELWEELIILTKARIGDKGLDFRVNIDPTIPKVLYGDNTRLKQVILNILTNAAKYTKEGFIDFTVSSVIKNDMVRLIISVEDSGIGIKEENLPRLFSKFDRLSVEKSITIEGTGLGLAITKRLVELMNGKIVVQSIYGKGSKFTVSIDQKIISYEVQHQKETTESNSKILDVSGAKVLIVDDNELNIKVATTLLKKYKLDIESCTSGFDCIEKINKGNKYDIIFLDDMMPKMSGKETLNKLKSINGFNIPVIALTANAIEGMKEEYLKCGFNDYLSKPIGKNDLEKILRTYISNKNNENTNSLNTTSHSSIIQDSLSMIEPDFVSEEKQSEEVVDNTDETIEEKVIEQPIEEIPEEDKKEITEEKQEESISETEEEPVFKTENNIEEKPTEETPKEEDKEIETEEEKEETTPEEDKPILKIENENIEETKTEPVEEQKEEKIEVSEEVLPEEEVKEIAIEKPKIEDTRNLFNTGSRKIIDVDLPMMKSEDKPKEEVSKEKEDNGYVLVVDDDDINLKVAKNTIGKYVSKIDTVKSGSEAIEKVIENKYDIIFMDDMMPELDGASTLDNLYDIDGFDTPTILMTANEMSRELKNKIKDHKFADYLSKPIDKEKLINILTKYIK